MTLQVLYFGVWCFVNLLLIFEKWYPGTIFNGFTQVCKECFSKRLTWLLAQSHWTFHWGYASDGSDRVYNNRGDGLKWQQWCTFRPHISFLRPPFLFTTAGSIVCNYEITHTFHYFVAVYNTPLHYNAQNHYRNGSYPTRDCLDFFSVLIWYFP